MHLFELFIITFFSWNISDILLSCYVVLKFVHCSIHMVSASFCIELYEITSLILLSQAPHMRTTVQFVYQIAASPSFKNLVYSHLFS